MQFKPAEDEKEFLRKSSAESIDKLRTRWESLCSELLPICEKDSLWRHRRGWLPGDPTQGWKIHISATILTACEVLQAVLPYLRDSGVEFKAVATLEVLESLNAGIFHGYSQIGKVITIYPRNDHHFCEIVLKLVRLIKPGIAAPTIPFEFRFRNSNIYYRYGSFINGAGGNAAIRGPDGTFESDRRDRACPDWAVPPFGTDSFRTCPAGSMELCSRFSVAAVYSQRGKGGVYLARQDRSSVESKSFVIKEGRRNGETAWDGRDGRSRLHWEVRALHKLRSAGIEVPIVYDYFHNGNNLYAVLEKVEGMNVHKHIRMAASGSPPKDTLNLCRKITGLLADLHEAGWVWRDCKPANLILTQAKTVRPVDFEGAHHVQRPDPQVWSSPNFSAPEIFAPNYRKNPRFPFAEDLYSLGATLFFVLTGKSPRDYTSPDAKCRTTNTSKGLDPLNSIIFKLLSKDPSERPTARQVLRYISLI